MTAEKDFSESLFSDLPNVSLIKGNLAETERQELVQKLIAHYNLLEVDVLQIDNLTMESSESIKGFCERVPFGCKKLIVVNLDQSSSRAQNSLLTLLESPPETIKFVLFSESSALTTVESRSHVFSVLGDKGITGSKDSVLKALAACAAKDKSKLEEALVNWTDEDNKTLRVWAMESISRNFVVFSPEEADGFGFSADFAENLIVALAVLGPSKAQWSARSIFNSYINKG